MFDPVRAVNGHEIEWDEVCSEDAAVEELARLLLSTGFTEVGKA